MVTIDEIITYFQNTNNLISLALDLFVIPIIVFIEAVTSGKVFTSISNFRRWYIVAKDPGFALNIALNSKIEPLNYQELNQRLSNSLAEIFIGTTNNIGEILRFKKEFQSSEASFEIHMNLADDTDQNDSGDMAETDDKYDSFIILVDIRNLKLSKIKSVLNEIQSFIIGVLIEKIKVRITVSPEIRTEDISIQFREQPKVIQSLKGFDIKEINGNYENYRVKAYDNKLVISGMINENTIDKIDGLIRANLTY